MKNGLFAAAFFSMNSAFIRSSIAALLTASTICGGEEAAGDAVPEPTVVLYQVRALYDNVPDHERELAFNEGHVIDIYAEEGEWFQGRITDTTDELQWLPSNFVERI